MRRLVQSPSARFRLDVGVEWLKGRRPDQPLLIITTQAAAATRLVQGALGTHGAVFGWRRTNVAQLAAEIARPSLCALGRVAVHGLAREAVCARVLHGLQRRGELGRFAAVAQQPGLATAMVRTLDELGMSAAEQLPDSCADLARIRAAYEAELENLGLIDGPQTLALAAQRARQGDHPLLGIPTLCLDVPVRRDAERALLGAVLEQASDALVEVPHGDDVSAQAMTAALGVEPDRPSAPSLWDNALHRLQSNLFEEQAPSGELSQEVVIRSAPGEGRECVEVARQLLWAAEAGMPFDRMAVLMRSAEHHRTHLESALRRAEIPAHFAAGTRQPDPAGRALLALLQCAAEGLSASGFAQYLSLHVTPGAVSAPRRWERLLVDAAVIGGRARWEQRLTGLQQALTLRAREQARGDEPFEDRRLDDLRSLREFALPLLDTLDRLPERAPWGHWIEQLTQLASQAIAEPERIHDTLLELAPMAELGPVGLDEVMRVLGRRLTELRIPATGHGAGRVLVATIEEARGLSFDLVCVMGLAEKVFPQKVREDPILLDAERERIGGLLATNEQRVADERLALHLAVGAADQRIVLSYARIDLDRARPRVPSFYGLEVLRAAEGRLPPYDELMRRAETDARTRVGWPAPQQARDAIDPAEYDLAVLQDLLVQPAEGNEGAARYLLGANPHLARALRFRARRWGLKRWSVADGLVGAQGDAASALANHRLDARAYSATALESYAACPYRFLLKAVFGLRPRHAPAPLEELDPLERGALIHEVQFRVLSALRDEGALPLTDANIDRALERLDEILDAVAADTRDRLAPAIDRVWRDGVQAVRADLRSWLKHELPQRWLPLHFELAFGLPASEGQDPASRTEPVQLAQGVQLRGSIDLVERQADRLRATDHKTGKAATPRDLQIGGGEVLQPLLYALALEALIDEPPVSGGRLYYCTARGGFEERKVALDDGARQAVRALTTTVDAAIADGFLPAAPRKGACEQCDYQVVCGPYEEMRTARKDPTRLQPLRALRRLP